ncbi:Semaphorin-4D [Manis pentadactyla]|nr:Semaphorin-4D [Manis pentadactyla]
MTSLYMNDLRLPDADFLTLRPGAPYHVHTGKAPQRHGGQGSAPVTEALSGAASGAQSWPPQPPSHTAQPLATHVHHI